MASGTKQELRTKAELLAELAVTRQALAADLPELYCRCNPVARIQRSIARNPAAWFTASAIIGVVGSKWLLSSPGKSPRTASKSRKAILSAFPAVGWLLKSAWTLAKPEAEKQLRAQLASYLNTDKALASPDSSKDSA